MRHRITSCESFKGSRIKRDNFICKGLKYVAEKPGWTSYEEPVIRDPTGKTKKPDIILVSKDEALKVVDIIVRNVYDKGKTPQKAAKEKRQKYRPLRDEIC